MIIGNSNIQNPLELIKCVMAFDSRDWFADNRDRMLWAIVFGIDKDCEQDYRNVGYTDEMVNEYRIMHKRYEQLLNDNYSTKLAEIEE